MLLPQLIINGFIAGLLHALVALSLALLYNTSKVFQFSLGAVYALAAYVCYTAMDWLGWPWPPAVFLAIFVAAAAGVATEALLQAPLVQRRASSLVCLLSSLGLYVILVNGIALVYGNETKVLRSGTHTAVAFGPVQLALPQIVQLLVGLPLLATALGSLWATRWGRQIRAVRDNPTLAAVMGVNVGAVRHIGAGAASALAGTAAVLLAFDGGIDPHMGMSALLAGAVGLIVGGIHSYAGSVVGGIFLGLIHAVLIWCFSARWIEAVTFAVMVAALLLRPQGLFGRRSRLEETTP